MSQGLHWRLKLHSSKMSMIKFTTALDVWLDGWYLQVELVSYSSELRFSMWIASEMYGFASAFVRTDMMNAFCSNSSAFSTTTAVQNHVWSTFYKFRISKVLFLDTKAIPLFLISNAYFIKIYANNSLWSTSFVHVLVILNCKLQILQNKSIS